MGAFAAPYAKIYWKRFESYLMKAGLITSSLKKPTNSNANAPTSKRSINSCPYQPSGRANAL